MSADSGASAAAVVAEASEIWLSRLPNEILMFIFRMLPSDSLMQLEKLGDSRIKSLTYDRSIASIVDFSSCGHLTSLLDFKNFFCPARAEVITELNFNDCAWIGTKHLLNCIIKCRNVSTLSIRDCGITIANIIHILLRTENLLSLEWTVDMRNHERYSSTAMSTYRSMKRLQRLYFNFINTTSTVVSSCSFFLPYCISLKKLCLHFVIHDSLVNHRIVLLPSFPTTIAISKVLENLVVLFDCKNQTHPNMISVYVTLSELTKVIFSSSKSAPWKSIWLEDSFYESRILDDMLDCRSLRLENFSCVSCIRVKGPRTYMEILRRVPKNNLHTLCMENIVLSTECFENLAQIVGNNLKRLQLTRSIIVGQLKLSGLLPRLFETCTNITEINFFGTHTFSEDTPCSALCALKGLKRVLLMACHMKRVSKPVANAADRLQGLRKRKRVVVPQLQVLSHPFRDMVENCSLVEEVHIMHCGIGSEHKGCDEEDIEPLSMWKNLKVLSLHKLTHLSSLNCLRCIATQCQRFESLNLDNVGNDSVITTLCFLFTSSESLSTVRITHSRLHLTNSFWHSLGCAKNLKNLCLVTGFWDRVEINVIVENLAKLKSLELFHFISSIRNVPKLSAAVKNLFGCNSKKTDQVDQGKELRKREVIINKINCGDSAFSHHNCSLDVEPFATRIGSPVIEEL